jgi:hypothetical protein
MKMIEKIAENESFPASVQAILHKAVEELAAKCIANPITDKGILSEGTVNLPAEQKKAQPGSPKLKI